MIRRVRQAKPATLIGGAIVALGVAAATVISYVPNTRAAALRLLTQAAQYPSDHWFAFGAGQVLIAACGILPASVMAVMAGAAYGLAWGLAISVVCTLLGGWIAFLLSRSLLRPWIERLLAKSPASSKFDEALEGEGWHFVFLLRISPVMPFALTSYGLGLTSISQRDYLLGTLASLPAMASYVALGAMGRQGMTMSLKNGDPMQWTLLIVGLIAIVLVILRTRNILVKIAGK